LLATTRSKATHRAAQSESSKTLDFMRVDAQSRKGQRSAAKGG
jgi:hypothetical protein